MLFRSLVSMRDLVLMRAQTEAGGTVPTAKAAPTVETSDAALRTHVEGQLLALYAELLKVSVEELDPEVPVSNYGVESVMMMTVLNRVEALFGKAVEPNAIVEHPAVRDFATHLIEEGVATAARLKLESASVDTLTSRQETSASPQWPLSAATGPTSLPAQHGAVTNTEPHPAQRGAATAPAALPAQRGAATDSATLPAQRVAATGTGSLQSQRGAVTDSATLPAQRVAVTGTASLQPQRGAVTDSATLPAP